MECHGERASGAAQRRRELRLRACQRHLRTALQLALAEKLHHRAGPMEQHHALWRQKNARVRQEGEEHSTYDALRGLSAPLPGTRPAPLPEVAGLARGSVEPRRWFAFACVASAGKRGGRSGGLLYSRLPCCPRCAGQGRGGGGVAAVGRAACHGRGPVGGTRAAAARRDPASLEIHLFSGAGRLSLVHGLVQQREEEEEEEEDQEDGVSIGCVFFCVCVYWTGFGFQANSGGVLVVQLLFFMSPTVLSSVFSVSLQRLFEGVSISTPLSGHYFSEPLVSYYDFVVLVSLVVQRRLPREQRFCFQTSTSHIARGGIDHDSTAHTGFIGCRVHIRADWNTSTPFCLFSGDGFSDVLAAYGLTAYGFVF